MGNQNETSGDAISKMLVSTAVLHAVMRELIRDPSISKDVLEKAKASVQFTCDHFAHQPDKATEADLWRRIYSEEIAAALTHRR